ncbi:hypothetical protein Tco_1119933 [Tanacetum coccineum]
MTSATAIPNEEREAVRRPQLTICLNPTSNFTSSSQTHFVTSVHPDAQAVDEPFILANYSRLEPLMRRRMRELRMQGVATHLNYSSEDVDEEREMEALPRNREEEEDTVTKKGSDRSHKPYTRRSSPKPSILHNRRRRHEKEVSDTLQTTEEADQDPFSDKWHKIREGESVRAFITLYIDETTQITRLNKDQRIAYFVHRVKIKLLVKFISTELPESYDGLIEKTCSWLEAEETTSEGKPITLMDNNNMGDKNQKERP